MTSSLAPHLNPTSNRSPSPSGLQSNMKANNVYRHQHSLSTSTPGNQHFGSLFNHYGGARSAGGPRQSLDVTKSLAVNGPISPRPPGLTQLRPNSEILSASGSHGGATGGSNGQPNQGESGEAEAIDKWFEDLQSYEATLEEMAAASLDVNFKEELNAIEQWFRVLSEAERTAALYSLMQSSTQVQIRFFITVLQQMARSDPMISMLSPALNPSTPSMEQQMEAKLSQLSMKSPASPIVRQFAHQSLTPNVNVTSTDNFLSPNSALFNEPTNSNDPASLLSAQRAKLNAKAANRLSAPGQLLSASNSLKSPKWNTAPGPVEEESHSRASSPRPRSNGAEFNNNSQNTLHPGFAHSINSTSGIEGQLSPIMGGSWASQVNTPLVPMFGNKDKNNGQSHDSTATNVSDVSNRLAQWGAAHQAGSNGASLSSQSVSSNLALPQSSSLNGFPLDDARKFRRQSKSAAADGSAGFSGVLSGMNTNNNSVGSAQANNLSTNTSQSATHNPNTNPVNTPRSAMSNGMPLSSPMNAQSMLGAQKAAVAAQQNWRQGLNSASMPSMNQPDPTMLKDLAMMNTLAAGLNGGINGMNMNGMANLAAVANIADPAALQNMANLLNMRQQMQQVQNLQSLQQQLQQSGMMPGGAMASPGSARFGMNFGFPMMSGSPNGMGNNKRSPAGRGSGKPTHTPGSGSNPDEDLDMNLLNDIPAWLRGLRLHKYTPNFAGCTWQEMVLMSDATLEARGVAAVGARRKMLRTFETVRIIKGMALPGDGDNKPAAPTSNTDGQGADQNSKPTDTAPAPESDKDTHKY
ncbi:hypothetical protein PGT21_030969 [Puccinia graminis f. sp. tritici]|uniref:RNA-binding protein VTS1 n=1 Tax=Puccinia graminis f. sp. tritici TaxID=56615 RepID=A0A5B0NZR8_PUCGR|nr:hypothetical protein PGTUg99_014815 [Puccinia graminis f. sp. tritici]KAA1094827.1 hypothetical protein PGT21_030969 [Puccinia graminis f. sp. tritici]